MSFPAYPRNFVDCRVCRPQPVMGNLKLTPPTTWLAQTYDGNGNLTLENRGGVFSTYSYDRENRLNVLNDVGALSTMTYAGDGLRRSKVVGAKTTTYTWDGSDYLSEQTS